MVVHRGTARNTMEWRDLPHERLVRFELYMNLMKRDGEQYNDRVCVIDKAPGRPNLRFLQLKVGAMAVKTSRVLRRGDRIPEDAQTERLGVQAYRVGFWDPDTPEAVLMEFHRRGYKHLGTVRDPWAPRPLGFGLGRASQGF